MGHRMRAAAIAVAVLAALAPAAPATATGAASAPRAVAPYADEALCDVMITITAQWSTGYVVSVTVRNISAVPVTWRANVTLPPPGFIIQIWNAVATQSGSLVTIYPPPYGWAGGLLLPGQSHTFGYSATGELVYPEVTCSG